jgi:hypothetical protein
VTCRAENIIPADQAGFICERCGSGNVILKRRPPVSKPAIRIYGLAEACRKKRKGAEPYLECLTVGLGCPPLTRVEVEGGCFAFKMVQTLGM